MAELYGAHYTREQLMARVGDISQIARIKPYRLTEGLEDGLQALDVQTGGGLDYTVLASRGLDISAARYNGRPLAWRSPTTDTHPAYFDHEGERGRGWLRSFYGGLIVTCGLTYAGANGEDQGQSYGLHGRISNLPATQVNCSGDWVGDDYYLKITGKVREATVFGANLELTRTITTRLGATSFRVQDTVENVGYKSTEHMMLYHINLGFPVVGDNSRIISPTVNATPRDADAEDGAEQYAILQPPEVGFREKVYFHEFPAGLKEVTVAVVNPNVDSGNGLGLGIACTYSTAQLPRFIEWKMMDAGTYVLGLEPANCLVMGRARERAAGTLQVLEAGEKRYYDLTLGVIAGPAAVAAIEASCRATLRSNPTTTHETP